MGERGNPNLLSWGRTQVEEVSVLCCGITLACSAFVFAFPVCMQRLRPVQVA